LAKELKQEESRMASRSWSLQGQVREREKVWWEGREREQEKQKQEEQEPRVLQEPGQLLLVRQVSKNRAGDLALRRVV
jgi:hypothetical protein